MKIGGWTRLWIVVSVLYLVIVAGFAYMNRPTAERQQHKVEYFDKLSEESMQLILSSLDANKVSRVEMPNGKKIVFPKGTPLTAMDKVTHEYWDIVKSEANEKLRAFVLKAILWWAIPCLVLYTLGWLIGWVTRGFKRA